MQIEKIQFDDVRYNPAMGGFEALIRIYDGGEVFSYPAHVKAPMDAGFSWVAKQLSKEAAERHRKGAEMRMVTPRAVPDYHARVASILSQVDLGRSPLAA